MKISDYMPAMYNKNIEMYNIINSEEIELENGLKPDIDNSFLDTFATVATEKGISNFEKIFNIKPDIITEDLELRRQRVLNRLITQIPYTEKFLIMKLNEIFDENSWTYNMDYNNYSLTITSLIPGRSWYNELLSFLDRIIPCNIVVTIEIFTATWNLVQDRFNLWEDLEEMTWEELADAEWSK